MIISTILNKHYIKNHPFAEFDPKIRGVCTIQHNYSPDGEWQSAIQGRGTPRATKWRRLAFPAGRAR
jgi:hypothetical protein